MKMESLKNVSLRGRIVYAIMCAERYVQSKYPNGTWKIVFKPFWEICQSETWDDWSDKVLEYIPEILMEFDSYEQSNFEYISKEEYIQIKKLYQKIDDNVDAILYNIRRIELAYSYSSIEGVGQESLEIIHSIVDILENAKVLVPDPQCVGFSKFSERNGWGNPFDGKGLSIILRNDSVENQNGERNIVV